MSYIALVPPTTYNVKQFGASGDGSTDDTSAIQTTIATAQSAGGGTIYFPASTYIISSALTVSSDNIQLVGSGWGSQIKAASSMTSGPMIYVLSPTDLSTYRFGIRIADLYLYGSSVSGVGGIQLDTTYHAELQHLRIDHCYGTGIYLNSPVGSHFGAYTHIFDCSIENGFASTSIGVKTNRHEWSTVTDTLISWYNTAGGIGVYSQNNELRLLGCSFDECDTSILLFFSNFNSIQGCAFARGGTTFINLNGATCTKIVSCQFEDPASSGTGKAMITVSNSGNKENIITNNGVFDGKSWTYVVQEAAGTGGSPPNIYANNYFGTYAIQQQTGIFRGNTGYNPVGLITAPAIPTSTVAYINNFGVDATVFISGGTVSAIAIGGAATGLTAGAFRIPAGQTIKLTYTVAPTWTWFGD